MFFSSQIRKWSVFISQSRKWNVLTKDSLEQVLSD